MPPRVRGEDELPSVVKRCVQIVASRPTGRPSARPVGRRPLRRVRGTTHPRRSLVPWTGWSRSEPSDMARLVRAERRVRDARRVPRRGAAGEVRRRTVGGPGRPGVPLRTDGRVTHGCRRSLRRSSLSESTRRTSTRTSNGHAGVHRQALPDMEKHGSASGNASGRDGRRHRGGTRRRRRPHQEGRAVLEDMGEPRGRCGDPHHRLKDTVEGLGALMEGRARTASARTSRAGPTSRPASPTSSSP